MDIINDDPSNIAVFPRWIRTHLSHFEDITPSKPSSRCVFIEFEAKRGSFSLSPRGIAPRDTLFDGIRRCYGIYWDTLELELAAILMVLVVKPVSIGLSYPGITPKDQLFGITSIGTYWSSIQQRQ